jgi:Uma2 family endonuclease
MTAQARIGMPMDEFIRLYDEAPFELIDGERRAIVPTVAEHGETLKQLYAALLNYERIHHTIAVYSELPFVLVDTPDWVKGARVPDVMVYRAERMNHYKALLPDWKKKPFVLVPDLCVEVISPTDMYVDVDEKVDGYLADGVRVVWVVNPRKFTVSIYTPDGDQITRLTSSAVLSDPEILPNFTLAVRDIFPA